MMSHKIIYLIACLARPIFGNEERDLGLLQNIGFVQVTKETVNSKIRVVASRVFNVQSFKNICYSEDDKQSCWHLQNQN